MKQNYNLRRLAKEFGLGLLGILFVQIETKRGLALFILGLSLGILFSPKSEDINYTNQMLLGFVLLFLASILIFWRIRELNKHNNKDKNR